MKNIWFVLIMVAMVIAVVGITGCGSDEAAISEGAIVVDTNSQESGIWVNGEGKVMAEPDLAEINLGIEVEANTVDEAQSQAAESMDSVMAALNEVGIDEKDIQTSGYSIYPIRDWDGKDDEYVLVGYRVSNTVNVKIRDLDKVGEIIDSVAEDGGDFTRIDGVNFSVEDPTPFKNVARDEAFAQAKAKAEQLADLSGMSLGKVTYVSESSYYASPIRMSAESFAVADEAGASTPISPGEQEIRVDLQVAFEFE